MTDKELCQEVAKVWVDHLGTANLFIAMQHMIVEAIKDQQEIWEDDREKPSKAEYWNWNDDRI